MRTNHLAFLLLLFVLCVVLVWTIGSRNCLQAKFVVQFSNKMAEVNIIEERKEAVGIGRDLGLTGSELNKFVTETLAEAKAERDRAERNKQIESQNDERKRKFELDELRLKLNQEVELTKIKKETDEANMSLVNHDPFSGFGGPQIKLPMFDEDKDSFDAYIARFESLAKCQKWPKDQWSIYLSSLLKSNALNVFHRMKVEDSMDFEKVKEALMQKFRLTKEGFRQRFRTSRPENNETPEQFAARLTNYCERWIDLSKINHTYEELFDFMIREQFLACCNREMIAYMKEKDCTSMDDVVKWSKRYVQAHGLQAFTNNSKRFSKTNRDYSGKHSSLTPADSKVNRSVEGKKYLEKDKDNHTQSSSVQGNRKFLGYGKGNSNSYQRGCYTCGDQNHISRNCPNKSRAHLGQALDVIRGAPESANIPNKKQGQWIWVPSISSSQNVQQPDVLKDNSKPNEESVAACLSKYVSKTEVSVKGDRHSLGMAYHEVNTMFKKMPVVSGRLMPGNKPVSVLRDTGCSTCVVKASLVNESQMTDKLHSVLLIDGTTRTFPVAKVTIDSPYLKDEVDALCIPNALCEVVVGNVNGARDPHDPDLEWKPKTVSPDIFKVRSEISNEFVGTSDGSSDSETEIENNHGGEANHEVMVVETRAQMKRKEKSVRSLKVMEGISKVSYEDFCKEQKEDESLKCLWEKAELKDKGDHKYVFEIENGLLWRRLSEIGNKNDYSKVLVVPQKYREKIMKMAHESLLSGHLGINNTRFCKSCDICQKTVDKGRVCKVPLGRMPLIGIPFQRIAMDLVGPLHPPSERGHRYVLTVIDYATRFVEALPLKNISTVEVAEALMTIYSRVGIPSEVLTDLGTQFVSDLMKEVSRLLSIKGLTSSRYHPICNGLVEKYNGLVKKILRRMCSEQPRQWDRFLPPLLFALREIPNSSLGYSPFEMLYGREVRGPLHILRELLTNDKMKDEQISEYQYVIDLRNRLTSTWDLAQKC